LNQQSLAPEGDERPPEGGVDHDEAPMLFDEGATVGFENLGVGAKIEAGIVSFNIVDIEFISGEEVLGVCLTVKDEHELGMGMKGVRDEEFEVRACVRGFVVGIRDQGDV
jgi:hypothetical protein